MSHWECGCGRRYRRWGDVVRHQRRVGCHGAYRVRRTPDSYALTGVSLLLIAFCLVVFLAWLLLVGVH